MSFGVTSNGVLDDEVLSDANLAEIESYDRLVIIRYFGAKRMESR